MNEVKCRLDAEFVMSIRARIASPLKVGKTLFGETRIIPVTGGRVAGPAIEGTIVPGGADWKTDISGSLVSFHARYHFVTSDGEVITVVNEGVTQSDPGKSRIKTSIQFLVNLEGRYAHLARGIHVGSLEVAEPESGEVEIRIYRLY